MSRPLQAQWRFPGGLSLPPHKDISTATPVTGLPVPPRLILPLQQHIGQAAEPVVKPGARVLRGQMVARAVDYLSAPVHASSSGRVAEIGEFPVPHPSGLPATCIAIDTDGADEAVEFHPVPDWHELDPSALRNRIREAGIVGLGGAAFPTYIKLNPGRHTVQTLILNGAECEPWISCDQMLMQEQAADIIAGARIICHALHADECLIAVEDSKPRALQALQEALGAAGDERLQVVTVPTVYPEGGEKQLIQVLTGREVPADGLPLDIGIVCHNVATAVAVHDAIHHGHPLISRIVSVTGDGIAAPGNFRVRLGTPIAEIVAAAGGYTEHAERLIMGGPMMGFALSSDSPPVVKASNCILALRGDSLAHGDEAMPCIRCGECAEACPVSLLPQQLYWHSRARDLEQVQEYNLFDCIECGCCALVCPSHIPLVQYYRAAKTEIWAREREREKSDIARQRYEYRQQRLQREQQEKQEKLRRKKEAMAARKQGAVKQDPQEAIKAARERAQQKKAGRADSDRNSGDD